jgi:hypothetical protein
MNAYVVLLRKLITLGQEDLYPNELFESIGTKEKVFASWVTLGHFDTMYAYSLPMEKQGLFEAIDKHTKALAAYQDKTAYSHPLYLICEENDQVFWEEKMPFAAILRIHFAESVHVQNSFKMIKDQLTTGELAVTGCQWRVYHTIEFSDMILVIKGTNLERIARMALSLRRCAVAGKVYTYFGIDTTIIKQPSFFQSLKEKNKEGIAWCSVRFSALNFQIAKEQAEYVRELLGGKQTYSIVGVDDIMVTAPEVPIESLVQLYHWCFCQAKLTTSDWTFSDITTRLGIPLEDVGTCLDIKSEQGPPQSIRALQTICERLQEQSWNIYHRSSAKVAPQDDWVAPLPKLSSILSRMGYTPVLDEFIYLMLPGVRAFLANVETHFAELSDADRRMCRVFVESWTDLTEHTMRIEGQLTHHPELRPVLYDIPVSMLEYTLAFLWQVMHLLQRGDTKKRGDTAFLLVPRLCSRIQAQELYPAQSSILPGLVLVTIPFHMLYHPEEIQLILAHEVSHFVGEKNRCRDLRLKCFIQSAAPLISKEILGSVSPAAVDGVQSSIDNFFQRFDKTGIQSNMNMIRLHLNSFLNRIAKDENFFSDLVRRTLQANGDTDTYFKGIDEMTPWAAQSQELSKWLDDLSTLYREVYADICMLALLPLEAKRYAQSLMSEISSDGYGRTQMVVRLYVCLRATQCIIPYQDIKNADHAFYEVLTNIENGDPPLDCFPVASIEPLVQYAHACFQLIDKQLNETDCQGIVQRIRETFRKISEKRIPYLELIEDVDKYRVQLLNDLCS